MSYPHASSAAPIVHTTHGPVVGFLDRHALRDTSSALPDAGTPTPAPLAPVLKFLGVPYARAGRFRRPSPPEAWRAPRPCFEFGTMFPQDARRSSRPLMGRARIGVGRRWVRQSEESHLLNVYAPGDGGKAALLPVMVWVYGGGLEYGSSDEPLYDGTALVREGMRLHDDSGGGGGRFLLVTGNYRTNVFGFFSGLDVRECDPEGLSGNYGLYDLVAMFEWVRANIARFGGDPGNVTAFGESAGAIAISQLFCSGKRLFRKAILQSGAPMTKDTREVEVAYRPYDTIMQRFAAGASTAAERMEALRAVPAADLLAAHIQAGGSQPTSMTWEAGTAGILSESVQLRLQRGEWDPWIEAVMAGTCEDEGTFFVWQERDANSTAGISKLLKRYPPMVRARARVLWPDNPTPNDLTKAPMALFSGDWTFNVPVLQLAKAMSGKNKESGQRCKVWLYRFRQPVESMVPGKVNFGVTHTMDLPATFHVEQLWNKGDGNAETAQAMISLWTAFAAHGTPGSGWKPFTPDAPSWLLFNRGGRLLNERIESYDDERTRFLSELLLQREPKADRNSLL